MAYGNITGTTEQKKAVAMNLYDYLRIRRVSQKELAEGVGAAESTISSYLSGKRYPRPEVLQAMAQFLGVSVADLTGETTGGQAQWIPPAEYQELSLVDRRMVDDLIRTLYNNHYGERADD